MQMVTRLVHFWHSVHAVVSGLQQGEVPRNEENTAVVDTLQYTIIMSAKLNASDIYVDLRN